MLDKFYFDCDEWRQFFYFEYRVLRFIEKLRFRISIITLFYRNNSYSNKDLNTFRKGLLLIKNLKNIIKIMLIVINLYL